MTAPTGAAEAEPSDSKRCQQGNGVHRGWLRSTPLSSGLLERSLNGGWGAQGCSQNSASVSPFVLGKHTELLAAVIEARVHCIMAR